MKNDVQILIYQRPDGRPDVEVLVGENSVWLTQKQIADLFGVNVPAISKHISNILQDGEINEGATVSKMEIVQKEGGRSVTRLIDHFSLPMIISVGYRVNSQEGLRFRVWATNVLSEYATKGFAMDDGRLSGSKKNYFDELQDRVRSIRTSERNFWQKITDIFATSIDYDPHAEYSKKFFANVQNMFHFAIHGKTAAELIWDRVDAQKVNLGLATWKGESISKEDVTIAKNFLDETELRRLNLLVEQYLSFAELQTIEKRPMRMMDWYQKLNGFFILNDKPILVNFGAVKATMSKKKAMEEYNKYERKRQDDLGNR